MGMVCFEPQKKRKNISIKRHNNEQIDNDNNINNFNITNVEDNLKNEEKRKSKEIKNEKSKEKEKEKNVGNINQSENIKDINEIYNGILKQHNSIRKKCHQEKLELNNKITMLAQKFADNYDSSEESNFIIDNYNNQNLGINYEIFKGDISEINNICESWINEGVENGKVIPNYSKYNIKTKHFSQMIAKNTKEIGIGYSELNNKEKIFIVYYYPAGDILK